MVDLRLVVKCRFAVCFVWGKMIKQDRWSERLSNQLVYGVYEVIDILVENQGTSHGKYSFNGYFKFMCEVKWTISLGTKVGQRVVENPFSNTYEQGGI